MLGWIHESMRQLILRKYGRDVWIKIIEMSHVGGEEPDINHYFKDEESFRLVNALGTVVGIPVEEVWEAYGGFLIQYTIESGWDELLKALSIDLEGFLDNIDSLHYFIDHVVYQGMLTGPSFRCDPNDDGTLTLHYYSKRSGLYPIVRGVVREVARRLFDTDIVMRVNERKQEHMSDGTVAEHVIYLISTVNNDADNRSIVSRSLLSLNTEAFSGELFLNLKDFANTFPHHLCFDENLMLEHFGAHVKRTYPFCVAHMTALSDILVLEHPEMPIGFDNFVSYINGVFVFRMKQVGEDADAPQADHDNAVRLKGQMILLEGGRTMLYLCAPLISTVKELLERGLYLSDLPLHDVTRDLILLNQSRMSQVELNTKLEDTTRSLKRMASELKVEKEKTDSLLRELLPASVADALRGGKTVDACEFKAATIVYTDIVTFTNICSQCTPYQVVNLLNDLYMRFDRLTGINDMYKVETIGDAYMVVAGCPDECEDHAEKGLNMAMGMQVESRAVVSPVTQRPIQIRAGVHSGAVVAGVVGVKMPRYCLFGDTVNTANRMESHGVPSKVHLSATTYKSASAVGNFVFEERGWTKIKGKGDMFTYFLIRNNRKSVWEIVQRERASEQSIDGYSELHDLSWVVPTAPRAPETVTPLLSVDKGASDAVEITSQVSRRAMYGVGRFLLKHRSKKRPPEARSTACVIH